MECVVCLEEITDRSSLFLCDHPLCEGCATEWAATQRHAMQPETCPMCRNPAIDDYHTVIGASDKQTLVFVRDNIILTAGDSQTTNVDETSVYKVCMDAFGPDALLMITRMSPARTWESFRMFFRVVPELDNLCTIFDMPIQEPLDTYKSVLRQYRALRRPLMNFDTIVMSRMFGKDDAAEAIMLRDFIHLRMLLCDFSNNPAYVDHQLVLELPPDEA